MDPKDRDRSGRENASDEASGGIVSRIGSFLKGEGETKATSMLKKDHEKVRAIFRKWENAEKDKVLRAQLVQQASRELTIHAEIEEKIFYPAVRDAGKSEAEKMVRESYEEHKIVRTLIEEIGKVKAADPQFEAKFTVLKELVEHHADEEESDLFPEVEDLFSDEKLESLGAEMEDLKEELMESAEVGGQPERKRGAPARRTTKRSPRRSTRGPERARP